jgi:hypothetical protein
MICGRRPTLVIRVSSGLVLAGVGLNNADIWPRLAACETRARAGSRLSVALTCKLSVSNKTQACARDAKEDARWRLALAAWTTDSFEQGEDDEDEEEERLIDLEALARNGTNRRAIRKKTRGAREGIDEKPPQGAPECVVSRWVWSRTAKRGGHERAASFAEGARGRRVMFI